MQVSSVNSNTNFKGITPIRVYKDGVEVLDERVIKNTCRKVIKAFSGPLETKHKPAAAQLAAMDSDYSYAQALRGYPDRFINPEAVPSDYIKVIYDRNNRGYLVTGPMSDELETLGYRIGLAKKECNSIGVKYSPSLEIAKNDYWTYVKNIGNNLRLRTREAFDRLTGEKIGKTQEMRIAISTKPVKSKGKITQKVNLENISFNDRRISG